MLDSQIPLINNEFQIERFDNEILLYSVTDTKAIYLNETAYLVYGMCNGQTIGEIIALLETAYPEQQPTIRRDVSAAIEQLAANRAITLQS
jgi:hypothetical protein